MLLFIGKRQRLVSVFTGCASLVLSLWHKLQLLLMTGNLRVALLNSHRCHDVWLAAKRRLQEERAQKVKSRLEVQWHKYFSRGSNSLSGWVEVRFVFTGRSLTPFFRRNKQRANADSFLWRFWNWRREKILPCRWISNRTWTRLLIKHFCVTWKVLCVRPKKPLIPDELRMKTSCSCTKREHLKLAPSLFLRADDVT